MDEELVLGPVVVLDLFRPGDYLLEACLIHVCQSLFPQVLIGVPAEVRNGQTVTLIEILREVTGLYHVLLQDIFKD